MDESKAKDIAEYAMAKGEADRLTSYLERGRPFKSLSAEELLERFIQAYRAWAADFQNSEANQLTSDLNAEYAARGLQPPYDAVTAEVDIIGKGSRRIGRRYGHRKGR